MPDRVPPYPTGDLPALINAHLTAPIPRPSQHSPQIPAAFDDVIAHGMAKEPERIATPAPGSWPAPPTRH